VPFAAATAYPLQFSELVAVTLPTISPSRRLRAVPLMMRVVCTVKLVNRFWFAVTIFFQWP
jgi:hypothetical protein